MGYRAFRDRVRASNARSVPTAKANNRPGTASRKSI